MRAGLHHQVFLGLLCLLFVSACHDSVSHQRPNIVLILADDLGYGDLSCYGQKVIETPNIDRLAASGMLFTEFYSGASVCAPARCVLLTGKHSGHAAIRGNDEWTERGDVWNYQAVYDDPGLEGQRPLPDAEVTIGELLQQQGYTTAFVGKWGLGAPGSEGAPNEQGFDYFFGYNCQRQAHTLYPGHLWENDERIYLDNPLLAPGTALPAGLNKLEEINYARFRGNQYAPAVMHAKAMNFISARRAEPFLLIYASPLPHLPLQAPEHWVEYYRNSLGDEEPYDGSKGYFPNYTPRATYAAMISTLDEQVGEIVGLVDSLGQLESTVFLFTSDNGPTYTGGADTEFFNSAGTFGEEYGRGKGFLHEGGIRVPMVASWQGHITPGSISGHISAFEDIMPTLIELTGAAEMNGMDGLSFLPELTGGDQIEHPYLFWEQPEYGGQMAVRMGQWKMIIRDIHKGNDRAELYDLGNDPGEIRNIAESNPLIVQEMTKIIDKEHSASEMKRFRFPRDN